MKRAVKTRKQKIIALLKFILSIITALVVLKFLPSLLSFYFGQSESDIFSKVSAIIAICIPIYALGIYGKEISED